jgi:dedicator of cytokinesis protein 3
MDVRLLDSYREFQSPLFMLALEHTRSLTNQPAPVPVTFPESYPFSMLSYIPHGQRTSHASSSTSLTGVTFNAGLGETAIVFLVLILSSPRKHILEFFQSSFEIEGRDNFATFLSLFFKVATSILDNEAFPGNWLNVNILVHKVIIKIMEPIATLMEKQFIPNDEKAPSFNAGLWQQVFHMLLQLLSSEQLAIEECSPQVRDIQPFYFEVL